MIHMPLLQLRGMYIARQLSFAGVTFDIREVSLTDKFIEMYDSSVEMVRLIHVHIYTAGQQMYRGVDMAAY